jgi:hypothetical protein
MEKKTEKAFLMTALVQGSRLVVFDTAAKGRIEMRDGELFVLAGSVVIGGCDGSCGEEEKKGGRTHQRDEGPRSRSRGEGDASPTTSAQPAMLREDVHVRSLAEAFALIRGGRTDYLRGVCTTRWTGTMTEADTDRRVCERKYPPPPLPYETAEGKNKKTRADRLTNTYIGARPTSPSTRKRWRTTERRWLIASWKRSSARRGAMSSCRGPLAAGRATCSFPYSLPSTPSRC